ncbi:hypothetical protein [Pseudomonas alabamensis]|uniref:hypothetical protein n=1 Tax=Pseudomonas alabamensis TaxID=3064349 RepID=UPI003F64E3B9
MTLLYSRMLAVFCLVGLSVASPMTLAEDGSEELVDQEAQLREQVSATPAARELFEKFDNCQKAKGQQDCKAELSGYIEYVNKETSNLLFSRLK